MPQGVGRSPHIEPRLFPIHRNQFLNRPNREMTAQPILEQRCLRRSKSEPLAGVIVIHPWRFWWVGF